MDAIKIITESFLLSLSGGLGIMTIFSDPKAVGFGLAKTIHGICFSALLISFCVYLSHGSIKDKIAVDYIINMSVIFFLFFSFEKLPQILSWVFYFLKILAFLGICFHRPGPTSLFIVDSLFIGSIIFGMILGHWYLVVPKLSEKPLLLVMKIIWLFLLAKMLLSIKGLFFSSSSFFLNWGDSFQIILLSMRFIWGYLAIFILSLFTWKLVKMRSIQSATGLLYIMVFFLLVGEMISLFLSVSYGQYL